MSTVRVQNADRMMTSAHPLDEGIEVAFADGCKGLIPFSDLSEIGARSHLQHIELSNPYEIVMRNSQGETSEIPWDFARHYCDPGYQSRVEAVALVGRRTLGKRLRQLRESARVTQNGLARAAGISRGTLLRIENGGHSPRFETLVALAQALQRPIEQLLVDGRWLAVEGGAEDCYTIVTLELDNALVTNVDTETWKKADPAQDAYYVALAA